jgi:gamma-glutamyltranspeptidase/glutathione hydrolase
MMTRLALLFLIVAVTVSALVAASPQQPTTQPGPTGTWNASGKNGAVASGGQEAADAGLAMLKGGGNAADAAVTMTLVMTVTDSALVALGGEVPILVYNAKRGSVEVISGIGTAPRLATREYFAQKGGIPAKGVEPAAMPATLDACLKLLERHGSKRFADVAEATLRLLDKKAQPWHADCAHTLRRLIDAERVAGNDRIRGLRLVGDFFYRGPLAREIDTWCRANGGLIRYSDLATYSSPVEEPLSVDYRGYTVYKCGIWTQGAYLLQTLRLLEKYDLKQMGHNRPDTIHLMAEAMKLSLADRDTHFADPRFADVPVQELLSREYADLRRPLIDLKRASLEHRPGDPRQMKALLEKPALPNGPGGADKDTTTCVAADRWGNVVAATPSGFNGVLVGKTGVWLGCRLQSFNTWEGHPNCIEPGKRPRITLTPGLVLKDGKPVLAVSSAGGDQQDQALLQLIVNSLDFGMSPAEAVTAPRFGTNHFISSFRQAAPQLGSLLLDTRHGEETIKELQCRGFKVTMLKAAWGRPVVVRIHHDTGVIEAAGDPTAKRNAGAY